VRHYEVKLSLAGSDVVPWTMIRRQTDVTFDGLTLAPGEYTFSVRALSLSGLMSDEASVPVTVTDQAPTDSGTCYFRK
jgi:predicted phage tail protein